MTGGWAVVGIAAVGLVGHSVRCLVRLLLYIFGWRVGLFGSITR